MRSGGNLVVAQSGGPTTVINSSLVGVIHAALKQPDIKGIYGSQHGVSGIFSEHLLDLRQVPTATLEKIRRTPSAALGTVRHKVTGPDYERMLDVFRKYEIRYFLYIGGNDSMDTTHKVHRMAADAGYELCAIGIPKTVDNDLVGTDHCPGFGSAARFVAMAIRDTGRDTEAMGASSPVKILEIMGRNAGWLTASSVLGREEPGDAPHLVYVPERPVSANTLLKEVEDCYNKIGFVVIALSEGATDERGQSLGSEIQPDEVDVFGHRMKGGAADSVAQLINSELGLKTRIDKPNYLQRSFMAAVSQIDLEESYAVGRAAVEAASRWESNRMITLVRESSSPYVWATDSISLDRVANQERLLPTQYLDPETGEITPAFGEYARPLIGGPLPAYGRLPVHRVSRTES